MGARTIPRRPLGALRARLAHAWQTHASGLAELAAASPLVRQLVLLGAAVAFIAALTYYGADQFSRRAVDQRASSEASSLAALTAHLATGDAYNAYLEMLRYSEDPVVRSKLTTPEARSQAMQQLLYLNTNNLSSLLAADRSGFVLGTTDPSITHVISSTAFQEARSTLTPSNTDVLVPDAGQSGYIEFAVPLKDVNGDTWGILLGRSKPEVLWRTTLAAQVDGSRNVIINSEGLVAGGAGLESNGLAWSGKPISGGGVQATVDGVRSICGLSAIGRGSPIDRGFTVASCLPSALVESEHSRAIGKQGWVTLSGAVLALLVAGAALHFGARRPQPMLMLAPPVEEPLIEDVEIQAEPEPARPPVDAVVLIDGYERRNERLAEQLREEVRGRLLLASSRADEAYRRLVRPEDAPSEDAIHQEAMDELENVRDRALRSIEQELYPAVIRLGLPNALKALRRDVSDDIDLTLELDVTADALDEDGEREVLDPATRLVLYRLVLDASRALAASGAGEATVALRRADEGLLLSIEAAVSEDELGAIEAALETSKIAVTTYGGSLQFESGQDILRIVASFPG